MTFADGAALATLCFLAVLATALICRHLDRKENHQ